MKSKRQIHEAYKTDCIETYSYEFPDGSIFSKLEDELKNRGVEFHPLFGKEITSALHSIYDNKDFSSFINLASTFLALYKSTYSNDDAFETLKKSPIRNNYERGRAVLFLNIVKDLYHFYLDYIFTEEKIDPNNMILQLIEELENTSNYYYKYIIVDEFHDIPVSRMKFLKKLIQHGNSKLFAVGDDWQAIYRFARCDVNFFLDFANYFGDSALSKITTTHRDSQELQDVVRLFIERNPEQLEKDIHSCIHLNNPLQIIWFTEKKYLAFLDTLGIIAKKDPRANVINHWKK